MYGSSAISAITTSSGNSVFTSFITLHKKLSGLIASEPSLFFLTFWRCGNNATVLNPSFNNCSISNLSIFFENLYCPGIEIISSVSLIESDTNNGWINLEISKLVSATKFLMAKFLRSRLALVLGKFLVSFFIGE